MKIIDFQIVIHANFNYFIIFTNVKLYILLILMFLYCVMLHFTERAKSFMYSRGSYVSHEILFARYFSVFSSMRR